MGRGSGGLLMYVFMLLMYVFMLYDVRFYAFDALFYAFDALETIEYTKQENPMITVPRGDFFRCTSY